MKQAADLLPWKVTNLDVRPFDGFWSFNPSVHRDVDGTWRCVLRCADYAMPGGVTIRSSKSRVGQQTKNALLVLDPATWQVARTYKMGEHDGYKRVPCANVGFEDMRIFRTAEGGLQGIAASLHLDRGPRTSAVAGSVQNQPPEQVLLSFDGDYNVVSALPIRGDGWSGTPQKNWVPFDRVATPLFLYSIGRGTLYDAAGPARGENARARAAVAPSAFSPPRATLLQGLTSPVVEPPRPAEPPPPPPATEPARSRPRSSDPRATMSVRGAEVQLTRGAGARAARGRRVAADAHSSRPAGGQHVASRAAPRVSGETSRLLGTGRALPPKYEGLRGGSQLVQVRPDGWLGIAHEMNFVQGRKYYWHTWYLVNDAGKLIATSSPMKLAPEGIEFAAGMAIEGDRVVVSFGVDDMTCRLGETRLSAVMEALTAR